MAVSSERVAVGTTATQLNTAGTTALRLTLNADSAVDLGDSSVSSGSGYELAASTPTTVEIDAGDVLHAIHGSGATVHVLRT